MTSSAPADRALPLLGRVALVTGGARRIGRAIVERLAAAGADVVIHDRAATDVAAALCEGIEATGRRAWTARADFEEDGAADALVADATALAGRPVDLLVNSASAFPDGGVASVTRKELHATFDVNAWAPLELTRAFARSAPEGASVVNVLDTRVLAPRQERIAYQLSKEALASITRITALEYAPRVRVNAVAPGAILPPAGKDDAYLDALASRLPLARHGSPDDVASAVVFLASSPFITGVVVPVDGGEHLGGR